MPMTPKPVFPASALPPEPPFHIFSCLIYIHLSHWCYTFFKTKLIISSKTHSSSYLIMASLISQLPYLETLASLFFPSPKPILISRLTLLCPVTCFPSHCSLLFPPHDFLLSCGSLPSFPNSRCICLQVYPMHNWLLLQSV